jgi:hypothetical protein
VPKEESTNPTPRRTRQHVIAAMSLIHVQKAFIDKGHTVDRGSEDYGYDLVATTFDEYGYQEDGDIRIQVKATDTIHRFRRGGSLSHKIKLQHNNLWMKTRMPVFLILYDAREKKAYWLYVQAYFAESLQRRPRKGLKSVTVRIPVANELTEDTIDYMRDRKAARLARMGDADHDG